MALLLAGVLALTGCGAAGTPDPGVPSSSPSPALAPPVIPADGVTLSSLGYRNGPTAEFSLPRTTVLTAMVDQADNVSAVLGRPSLGEVYAYLERSLPAAGFTITGQDAAAGTLTFRGRGWTGSFTGDDQACAVLLRPV